MVKLSVQYIRNVFFLFARCSVCETSTRVIAIHSQSMSIPDCPGGWEEMWTGYSYFMVKDYNINNNKIRLCVRFLFCLNISQPLTTAVVSAKILFHLDLVLKSSAPIRLLNVMDMAGATTMINWLRSG